MKATASQHRRRGRPTIRDKNRRPVPVRPDRDQSMEWFFEEVPQDKFYEALQLSGDKRFYRLYDALHDPAYRNTSPMTLCRKLHISLTDLHDLWRKHNLHLGMIRLSTSLPEVLDDICEDAKSRETACPSCEGIGEITHGPIKVRCAVCEGIGYRANARVRTCAADTFSDPRAIQTWGS